ncbi:MAG: biosynthetic-type acetolactate synthase large subunit, partial [Clostridia bacterium]
MKLTGAELFFKALKAENTDVLFAYPGGQVINLFDVLYGQDDIKVILPRHEQGLIHAADGYARSTGKVGVCLVTSGPGATNLVTGIATANCDSVPLVCFTGQVPTNLMGRNSFQEVDITSITKSICKYAVTVRKREDLPYIISEAFRIAESGKPGVAVVDFPKDIQTESGSDFYPAAGCKRSINPNLSGQINKALDMLSKAKKPLFLAGGGVKIAGAEREMQALAEATGVPVITTIMGKGAVPSSHELYAGNLGIHGCYAANTAVSDCDLLFAIGTRFNDRITGKAGEFAKNAAIIRVDAAADSLSGEIDVGLAITADAKDALRELLKKAAPLNISDWREEILRRKRLHPIYMGNTGMTPQRIIRCINDMFTDSIISTDVGQNQLWATQFLDLDCRCRLLTSGGMGTMGYGLPAAIGAKIGNPQRDVLVISGDGGIQMNLQELATAVVYELPIIICIFNNGYLGNV